MSRFVDVAEVHRVDLGEGEWADMRSRLSGLEVAAFASADDTEAALIAARYIPAWSLCDDEGKPVPVTGEAITRLDAVTMTILSNAIGEVVSSSVTVPNGSGAPSRATSRASASRTRTTRTRP